MARLTNEVSELSNRQQGKTLSEVKDHYCQSLDVTSDFRVILPQSAHICISTRELQSCGIISDSSIDVKWHGYCIANSMYC